MTENKHDSETEKLKREELQRQALLIQKLATRLPWIVMSISLLAFLIIFAQVLLMRK